VPANPGIGVGPAAERYDELLAKHPQAFADHAAEFWLAAGADPDKALRLAKMNLEVRNTPRARGLLAQAVAAKASFVDSSGHADRNFVFTCGCKKDSNETATKGSLT
jgi:hypothetical protein